MSEVTKKMLRRIGVIPLKSDNIKMGCEIPRPNKLVGIVMEEMEMREKGDNHAENN